MSDESRQAFRASFLHCIDDPREGDEQGSVEYLEDGLLIVEDGRVSAIGAYTDAPRGDLNVIELRGKLVVPGFVDCHVHYPQVDMIGSYGTQLLEWLEHYAYPEEQKFADLEHAERVAKFFVDALLQNGTTTALVFATVHAQSADAMFAAAREQRMRLITGKVLMDFGCPEALRDSPEAAYKESRELIEKWHGVDRLGYAITPRFALTSSDAQLRAAGRLAREFPEVHVHTHLAENAEEIAAVAKRFPTSDSYLDVYTEHNLVRDRSVFAHCLHLDDADRSVMAERRASAAFCPSSNLFLGSGLFDLAAMDRAGIRVGIGSDVGGGTSLSALRTLGDGYKVLQLNGQSLSGFQALYLATLGGARALSLDAEIGNFSVGKEADFVVLDPPGNSMSARRLQTTVDVSEQFFALMTLGEAEVVHSTYVLGKCAYTRSDSQRA